MEQLQISKQDAITAYSKATKENKALLEELFGKKVFIRDIMERVKTWKDACEIKGWDPVKCLPYTDPLDSFQESINGFFKVSTIVGILNEGWVPDWSNSDEYKYYPYFYINSGGGFAFGGYYYICTCTHVGGRLVFKTRELATYAGKQFIELYKSFYTI